MPGTTRAALAAILLSFWATPSSAIPLEQKAQVRELVKEGGELSDQGRYAEARDRFMAALNLARVPAIALYAARAHEHLRELLKAAQLYRVASDMPLDETLWDNDQAKTRFQLSSREEAKNLLRQLLESNCTVKIQIVGAAVAEIQATVDGIVLEKGAVTQELPLEAGSHVVSLVQGSTRLSQAVNLDRADHKTVTFDLTPRPAGDMPGGQPSMAAPQLTQSQRKAQTAAPFANATSVRDTTNDSTHGAISYLTWTAYGVGAVGLGTSILAGIVTLSKRATLISEGCTSDGICPRNKQIQSGNLDSYNAWRNVTTAGFIVGSIGAVAGITLTVAQPSAERRTQVTLHVAPDSIVARGTF